MEVEYSKKRANEFVVSSIGDGWKGRKGGEEELVEEYGASPDTGGPSPVDGRIVALLLSAGVRGLRTETSVGLRTRGAPDKKRP